jgi:hypothetical protein
MSIGGLGGVSSLAATPAMQRSSDVDKTQTATADKSRADAAVEYAERASGIGETQEESEASDRDADGRRIWEIGEEKKKEEPAAEETPAGTAKDPTGESGGTLDLVG